MWDISELKDLECPVKLMHKGKKLDIFIIVDDESKTLKEIPVNKRKVFLYSADGELLGMLTEGCIVNYVESVKENGDNLSVYILIGNKNKGG